MESKQRKTFTLERDGLKFSGTYTQRSTTQLDEGGLRKALTAKVFDQYTVKKLDRKALEKAMSEGEVDPMVVAKFAEQIPGKKFLTFRVKKVEDGDAQDL